VFGVPREQTFGKDITMIMPNFYHNIHKQGVNRLIETGKPTISNKSVQMYGLDNVGFLVPIWLHVKINPQLERGLSFLSIIRPYMEMDRVILV